MEKYDVVVIGGGVAGLNIAQLLGAYKLKVCLLELKQDLLNVSFNTLGSFINLDKFGLTKNVVAADIRECVLHSRHVETKKSGKAHILNKKQLHRELLDKAIGNNVDIKTSVHISKANIDKDENANSVVDESGKKYFSRIFIDASGIEGILSKQIGLQECNFNIARGLEYNVEYLGSQNQIHLFIGQQYEGGYAWTFPVGGNRAITGYGTFSENMKKELKEVFDSLFELAQFKKLVKKDNDDISGSTIPITEVKRKFVCKNIVCIGDSVSQVNPFVGEGYRFIMEAGFIAAPYIYKSLQENNLEILHGYENEWNSKFYAKYTMCKKAQKIAAWASKNDFITDLFNIFLLLKRNKTFEKIISGDISRREIFLP